jgi:receptor expression-enhancing protein 1/2/3/4
LASLGAQGAQSAGVQGQGPGGVPVPPEGTIGASQPPTLASPLSGPAQMLGGLWRTYGPSLIATGATFVQNQQANLARARTAGASAATSSTSQSQPPVQGYEVGGATSGVSARSSEAQAQSNISQRRGGPPTPGASSSSAPGPGTPGSAFGTGPAFPIPQLPIPTPGQQFSPGHPSPGTGSTNGSGDERDRRYETISHEELEEHREGEEAQKNQGGSWFPWSPGSKGYERVKSE